MKCAQNHLGRLVFHFLRHIVSSAPIRECCLRVMKEVGFASSLVRDVHLLHCVDPRRFEELSEGEHPPPLPCLSMLANLCPAQCNVACGPFDSLLKILFRVRLRFWICTSFDLSVSFSCSHCSSLFVNSAIQVPYVSVFNINLIATSSLRLIADCRLMLIC